MHFTKACFGQYHSAAWQQVMVYLHQRGVKGFVTVNVLIFDEELAAVEEHIRHIAACGVDAVIVQACPFLSFLYPQTLC